MQPHRGVVNLVRNLRDHLSLVVDLLAKVFILILDMLHDGLNLVEVAILVGNLLPLQLNQLLARLPLVVLHILIAQPPINMTQSCHLVVHRVAARHGIPLGLLDQVLHISRALFDQVKDWVGIVIDFHEFLASFHQFFLGYV